MTNAHGVARDQLRAFVERIERLEEEKKTIADDIKDVYGEAKSMGFDTKILKKVIALRKKDEQERTEEEMILDTYLQALGMIPQFEMFDREEVRPVSREERRRQIMSEDMADHKALLDEMADAGLISEEARAENKALADAVATKFGNGPAKPLQSPRKAAEAVSERTAINRNDDMPVVANGDVHRDTGSAMARTEASAVTAGETATNPEMDRDGLTGNAEEAVPAENARKAVPETEDGSVTHAGAGESPATNSTASDQPLAGGDHVTAHPDNAATADGLVRHTPSATIPKTAKDYRPNCLKPDACGASGLQHCYSCRRAMQDEEAA